MSIEIRSLARRFGTTLACDDIDLKIPDGELVALLGPSGCGKTTLLRIIAGLEIPDRGQILFDGIDTTGTDVRDRRVGFVFQQYALFGHMTVLENVAFGLRVRPRATRPDDAAIRRRVMDLLERVQLAEFALRYPRQLSGGQRQRVALARALAVEPRVLLLDEPFGALDTRVRQELRGWLRRIHDELHITSLLVTHDQEEAMEVADRVVILNRGRIEQSGTPTEVYDQPASPFVFGFLGDFNRLPAARTGERAVQDRRMELVRPHELEVVADPGPDTWPATLLRSRTIGPQTRLAFQPDQSTDSLEVVMPRATWDALQLQTGLQPGARTHLRARRITRFHTPLSHP